MPKGGIIPMELIGYFRPGSGRLLILVVELLLLSRAAGDRTLSVGQVGQDAMQAAQRTQNDRVQQEQQDAGDRQVRYGLEQGVHRRAIPSCRALLFCGLASLIFEACLELSGVLTRNRSPLESRCCLGRALRSPGEKNAIPACAGIHVD